MPETDFAITAEDINSGEVPKDQATTGVDQSAAVSIFQKYDFEGESGLRAPDSSIAPPPLMLITDHLRSMNKLDRIRIQEKYFETELLKSLSDKDFTFKIISSSESAKLADFCDINELIEIN